MNAKPRALLVCPEPPYPMYGGGAMRTASILQYLAAKFRLDAVLFHEEGEESPAARIPQGLVNRVQVLMLPRHSRSYAARAARNLKRLAMGAVPLCDRFHGRQRQLAEWLSGHEYDLTVLEHFWLAPYQPTVRGHSRRVVLDLHNIESVLLERTSNAPGGASWALRRFAALARKAERAWLPQFDALWATSDADAALVRGAGVPVTVYPNALPDTPLPVLEKHNKIAFSGNWAYSPNRSGLSWFLEYVWPKVRRSVPQVTLVLVGQNSREVQDLLVHAEGVECSGGVAEAIPWIAQARIAVAPLLAGSGTRLKIVEAWAAGVPVVATSVAAEGLDAVAGCHLLVEDSPEGFARAILHLLDSSDASQLIAGAGRRLFEASYSWPAAWEKLAAAGF